MTPLALIALGGAIALLLLPLLRQPLLAAAGLRHAVKQPRQLGVAVLGLMIGTSVIVAGAVLGDSAQEGSRAAVLQALGGLDLAGVASEPTNESHFHELFAQPPIAALVEHYVLALRVPATILDLDTLQSEHQVPVWGIEPAEYQRLLRMNPQDGKLPDGPWSGESLANAELARLLGARPGHRLTFPLLPHLDPNLGGPPQPPPSPPTPAPVRAAFQAELVATSDDGQGGYTHSPLDAYAFRVTVPPDTTSLDAFTRLASPSFPPDIDLEVHLPNATTVHNRTGTPDAPDAASIRFQGTPLPPGEWRFLVHAKAAINASIELVVWHHAAPSTTPPDPLPGTPALEPVDLTSKLRAIVADRPSDPVGEAAALFVPRADLQEAALVGKRVNQVLIGLRPDVDAASAARIIQDAAARSADPNASASGRSVTLHVQDHRTRASLVAAANADDVRYAFLALGSFPIAAGAILVVGLMGVVVEERKRELATVRATGGRRLDVVAAVLGETAMYAACASLAGAALGVLVAGLLLARFGHLFPDGAGDLHVDPSTIIAMTSIGFILTWTLVLATSAFVTRFNIAAALKGLDLVSRSTRRRARFASAAIALLGLGATSVGMGPLRPLVVVGPLLFIVGASGLALRLSARWRVVVASTCALAWTIASFFVVDDLTRVEEAILFPVRGVLLATAGAILLVYAEYPVLAMALLLRFLPSGRGMAMLVGAQARRRMRRSALTVLMVAVAMLSIVLTSILFRVSGEPAHGSGDYDVVGHSVFPIDDAGAYLARFPPPPDLDPRPLVERVHILPYVQEFLASTQWQPPLRADTGGSRDLLGIDADFAQNPGVRLTAFHARFETAAAALTHVASRNDSIALRDNLLDASGRPLGLGSRILLQTDSGTTSLEVVARFTPNDHFGAMVHPDVLGRTNHQVGSMLLATVRPGVDASLAAQRLEASFRAAQLDAVSTEAERAARGSRDAAFVPMVQGFLGLGLMVGLVSVGIFAYRGALEQERETGALRAIGVGRTSVVTVVTFEALSLVTLGMLVGVVAGIFCAFLVVRALFAGTTPDLTIDGTQFAAIVAFEYAAALVAATLPAYFAANVSPARATSGVT